MSSAKRLGLGTAQWGLEYGIANSRGRPDTANVVRMLDLAASAGIDTIDTASAYGGAEALLGKVGAAERGYRIVSKTAIGPDNDEARITAKFRESLNRLQSDHVDLLLVHHGSSLLSSGGDKVWAALTALRDTGEARRIGVSVYSPIELSALLERFDIEGVQLPYNIYDQRFAQAGLLDRLNRQKIEVHVRSVFLQGILLMTPDKLPPYFGSIAEHQRDLHAYFARAGVTALQGALRFCLENTHLRRIIIGCETYEQLAEIVAAAAAEPEGASISEEDFARFAIDDVAMTNPSNWPSRRS